MSSMSGRCMLISALLVAGCHSPAVRLYTLVPPAPVALQEGSTRSGYLQVDRIVLPSDIDRKELVLRKSTTELLLLENDNWASPINVEFQDALAGFLNRIPDKSPSLTRHVSVTVHQWEAAERMVSIDAIWRVRSLENGTSECRGHFRREESVAGGVSEVVRAQQRLVEGLSSDILAALASRCQSKSN